MKKPALIAKVDLKAFCLSILAHNPNRLEAVLNLQRFLSLNSDGLSDEIYDLTAERLRELTLAIQTKYRLLPRSAKIGVVIEEGAEAERVYAEFLAGERRFAICFGVIGYESLSLIDLASKNHAKKTFLNFKAEGYPPIKYSNETPESFPSAIDFDSLGSSIRYCLSRYDFFELCEKLNYSLEQKLMTALYLNVNKEIFDKVLSGIENENNAKDPRTRLFYRVKEALRYGLRTGASGFRHLFAFLLERSESPFWDEGNIVRFCLRPRVGDVACYLVGYNATKDKLQLISEAGNKLEQYAYEVSCKYSVSFYEENEDSFARALPPAYLNGRLVDARFFGE
jgi:hypothetical protein